MTSTRHTMMWEAAVDALERAERLHRQFFRLAGQHARVPIWEPPIEVFEHDGRLAIVVALPGVPPDQVSLDLEGGTLAVAALRAGIGTVLLPARNAADLEGIPADARSQLRFVLLETVDDALRELIETRAVKRA
ncbi:Lon protease (S16) C-terminal proteolytic domain-containing protein [Burkholderia sp. OK233]|nr:Lon protease (S16) C-terminal proteolytic domain-containing protein [Burkholderia sp. OK233]